MLIKQFRTFITQDINMLKDKLNNSANNQVNPSIKKGTILKKLITFIENTLLIFQEEFKGNIETSEEVLNEKLVLTLSFYSKSLPFVFQQESIQKQTKGQNRKVDIGVFLNNIEPPFFTIEAKRLTKLQKNREKEYVIGSIEGKLSGGIERFKHNVHGIDLPNSALVAYVQKDNFKEWQKRINTWITELINNHTNSPLIWSSDDLLEEISKNNKLAIFKSNHRKINNSQIRLQHYFISMVN